MSEQIIANRNTNSKTLVSRNWWMELEGTNNQGILIGKIQGEFQYSHSFCGQIYHKSRIEVSRRSGVTDVIPIIIQEAVLRESRIGKFYQKYVKVTGQICTYDLHDGLYANQQKHYLRICFAADSIIEILEDQDFNNSIYLKGQICTEIFVKQLFSGDKVAQIMLKVTRKDGRRNFIPCVAWRENADYIEKNFKEGDRISLLGRFQSRKFVKHNQENSEISETRTAYEVGIRKII